MIIGAMKHKVELSTLKKVCKDAGEKGYSKLKKKELVKLLDQLAGPGILCVGCDSYQNKKYEFHENSSICKRCVKKEKDANKPKEKTVEELQKRIEELEKENEELKYELKITKKAYEQVKGELIDRGSGYACERCREEVNPDDEEYCKELHGDYYCYDCAKEKGLIQNECNAHNIGCDCYCEKCSNLKDCDENNKGNRKCKDFYGENDRENWCAECIFLSQIPRYIEKEESDVEDEHEKCEDCKEDIVQGGDECPTTCYECDKIYHGNCVRGNIRYIENECEDYCYKCKDYGASDCEESDSESESEEEVDFKKITVKELKALCKSKGIKGYSKLKKQQLIELLKQQEEIEEQMLCQCCEEKVNSNDIKYIMILGYGWDNICKKCIEKDHEKCECGNIRRKDEKIDYDDFCDSCRHWRWK